MTLPSGRPIDVSVRQFVADSGAVTRGEEVLAIFATAPALDVAEPRADLDETVSQAPRGGRKGS